MQDALFQIAETNSEFHNGAAETPSIENSSGTSLINFLIVSLNFSNDLHQE